MVRTILVLLKSPMRKLILEMTWLPTNLKIWVVVVNRESTLMPVSFSAYTRNTNRYINKHWLLFFVLFWWFYIFLLLFMSPSCEIQPHTFLSLSPRKGLRGCCRRDKDRTRDRSRQTRPAKTASCKCWRWDAWRIWSRSVGVKLPQLFQRIPAICSPDDEQTDLKISYSEVGRFPGNVFSNLHIVVMDILNIYMIICYLRPRIRLR